MSLAAFSLLRLRHLATMVTDSIFTIFSVDGLHDIKDTVQAGIDVEFWRLCKSGDFVTGSFFDFKMCFM